MTIEGWLEKVCQIIDRLDAELILVHFLHVNDRSYITAHPDERLPNTGVIDIQAKRRASGEPLAYILGWREFYGRRFFVTHDTLIPRPETEAIIEMAIKTKAKNIVDIGTGSGCIAITLALEMPETHISATDISPAALKVAQKNAKHLGAEIDFRISDLLDLYHPEPNSLIIANLPYVDPNWDWIEPRSLNYEPALALYAKDHGLALIKRLIKQCPDDCEMILEADPCQHQEIIDYAKNYGFKCTDQNGYILHFK